MRTLGSVGCLTFTNERGLRRRPDLAIMSPSSMRITRTLTRPVCGEISAACFSFRCGSSSMPRKPRPSHPLADEWRILGAIAQIRANRAASRSCEIAKVLELLHQIGLGQAVDTPSEFAEIYPCNSRCSIAVIVAIGFGRTPTAPPSRSAAGSLAPCNRSPNAWRVALRDKRSSEMHPITFAPTSFPPVLDLRR